MNAQRRDNLHNKYKKVAEYFLKSKVYKAKMEQKKTTDVVSFIVDDKFCGINSASH